MPPLKRDNTKFLEETVRQALRVSSDLKESPACKCNYPKMTEVTLNTCIITMLVSHLYNLLLMCSYLKNLLALGFFFSKERAAD